MDYSEAIAGAGAGEVMTFATEPESKPDTSESECSAVEWHSAEEEPCNPEELEIYRKAMREMNKQYAVCMVGTSCVIMEEFYDPVFQRKDVQFLRTSDFQTMHLNKKIPNPWRTGNQKKYINVATLWLASALRKEYERVMFDPSNTVPESYYNLFQGFARSPGPGDWSLLREHIFENICDGDEKIDHYVMSWLARILQKPGGERPGTALVFKGVQGCGKGTLINAFGKIIGVHYRHILHLNHLTGKFNSHLKDALLVFCDEITWGGDKQTEGILKGLITEPTVPIEQKGKDVMELVSYINVAIASNNDWVVPTSMGERRFVVLNVRPDRAGDRAYFNAMYEQLENGGYEAMMHDLLNYDRLGTNELRDIPRTQGLLEQTINSMTPLQKFWFQRLMDGTVLLNHDTWEREVKAYALYNAYQDFCDSIGSGYKMILNQFVRKLRDLCPSVEKARPRIDGKQENVYLFPSLEKCRAEFQDAIKIGIDWNEDAGAGEPVEYRADG